ncbi:MAG: sulfatase [Planctomycetota bacterium]
MTSIQSRLAPRLVQTRLIAILAIAQALGDVRASDSLGDWPGVRGPGAGGVAMGAQANPTARPRAVKGRPNILFIAVDDLRPNLGCYGDTLATTPHIDRLAGRGVCFRRAYCQVAVCNPSRASLMTGLRPDTLGVWTLPIHFREAKPDAITLPQWFRRFGYTAVSHGKIYHNPTPDPQSWSEPIRKLPSLPAFYPNGTRDLVQNAMAQLPRRDWRKNNIRGPATAAPDLPDNQLLDGARTDMCIEDLRRLGKSNQPFFLAMGFIRPHLSFVAPKKYWDLYDANQFEVLTKQPIRSGVPQYALHNNSELSHYVDMIDVPPPWAEDELDQDRARRLIHGYHACVSYVDAQIGRLLDALDEEGLDGNTIVVLWSDHGYKLGEYRGWGKMTNYEIDTRVPLVISAPQYVETAGECTDALAALLDLFPTLCDLSGLEMPSFVEGKSLVPVLRDPGTAVRDAAVSQYYRRLSDREVMGYALRTDTYRYVEWREFATGDVIERELYEHDLNPEPVLGDAEDRNLVDAASPDLVDELSSLLNETHPPRRLVMTPAVHTSPSGAGRWPVKLTFRNESRGLITAYPILPTGQRNRGRSIKPGEAHTFQARLGGVYVIESVDGSIHEIHSPRWPERTVVIGDHENSFER